MTIDNSHIFKYETPLVGKVANSVNNTNSAIKDTNIAVPLKYLSNFWISLEMSLINCKINLELIGLESAFYQVLETLQNLK